MKTITKTKFKQMHESGELKLLVGGVKMNKDQVYNRIKEVEHEIEKYEKEVTNYGNIESDKNGIQTCNIYISDCENYIFVECVMDYSKDNNCSWNDVQTFTTAYKSC